MAERPLIVASLKYPTVSTINPPRRLRHLSGSDMLRIVDRRNAKISHVESQIGIHLALPPSVDHLFFFMHQVHNRHSMIPSSMPEISEAATSR